MTCVSPVKCDIANHFFDAVCPVEQHTPVSPYRCQYINAFFNYVIIKTPTNQIPDDRHFIFIFFRQKQRSFYITIRFSAYFCVSIIKIRAFLGKTTPSTVSSLLTKVLTMLFYNTKGSWYLQLFRYQDDMTSYRVLKRSLACYDHQQARLLYHQVSSYSISHMQRQPELFYCIE